jgi:putative PIN family toxin of toxin-antitoxin system
VDTNVLVSGLLSPRGTPGSILRALRTRQFDVVTSPQLVGELSRIVSLHRIQSRFSLPTDGEDLLAELDDLAFFVDPPPTVVVARDPADNRVLEAAVAGEADYIVSGDADLLSLGDFRGIPIVPPAYFLALLAEG